VKSCPSCAESIETAAIKCLHCGEFLECESRNCLLDADGPWRNALAVDLAFLSVQVPHVAVEGSDFRDPLIRFTNSGGGPPPFVKRRFLALDADWA
jgi:hypothetical protein